MGRTRRGPWLATVAVGLFLSRVHGADIEKPRNIVLIGWDAAQRAHVQECLARGELPALQALAAEGALLDVNIQGKTDTKAGWTEILTGYGPKITGVYSNGRYRAVPKGLSIFERLEEHFGADRFVTVAVIGKKRHCGEIDPPRKIRLDEGAGKGPAGKNARGKKGRQPGARRAPRGEIVEEDGVRYRVVAGSPYYHMHRALEVWEFGLMKDEKVGRRAIELLEKHRDKPFFFFVHFAEVDHSGHRHGENSKQYNDALLSNDAWTGRIVGKLKELGLYDQTLVYIAVDHGFDEGEKRHRNAPHVFMATNDTRVAKRTAPAARVDIPVTILERFGLDVSRLDPPLTGKSLLKPAG